MVVEVRPHCHSALTQGACSDGWVAGSRGPVPEGVLITGLWRAGGRGPRGRLSEWMGSG